MLKRFAQATKQYVERGRQFEHVWQMIITFQLQLTYQAYAVTVKNPIPPSEKLLFTFKNEKDLARWSTFTDQEFGGQSEAKLALSETTPVRGTAFGSVNLFCRQPDCQLGLVNSNVPSTACGCR